jgi:hypothetical protein
VGLTDPLSGTLNSPEHPVWLPFQMDSSAYPLTARNPMPDGGA